MIKLVVNNKVVEVQINDREPMTIFTAIADSPLTVAEIVDIQDKLGFGTENYYVGAHTVGQGKFAGKYVHSWSS